MPLSVRQAGRTAVIAVAALTLGACGRISQRAIANKAAMGPQQPLQQQDFRTMSSMRQRYYQSDPLSSMFRQRPYSPRFRRRY